MYSNLHELNYEYVNTCKYSFFNIVTTYVYYHELRNRLITRSINLNFNQFCISCFENEVEKN